MRAVPKSSTISHFHPKRNCCSKNFLTKKHFFRKFTKLNRYKLTNYKHNKTIEIVVIFLQFPSETTSLLGYFVLSRKIVPFGKSNSDEWASRETMQMTIRPGVNWDDTHNRNDVKWREPKMYPRKPKARRPPPSPTSN